MILGQLRAMRAIGYSRVCDTIAEWDEDFSALRTQAGVLLAEASSRNGADFDGDLDAISEVCLNCLRAPIGEAAENCVSNGYPVDHMIMYFVCPYPSGIPLPVDEDGQVKYMAFSLGWMDGSIAIRLTVIDIGDAGPVDLTRKMAPVLEAYSVSLIKLSRERKQYWATVHLRFPCDMRVSEAMLICAQIDAGLRRVAWDLRDPIEGFSIVVAGEVDRFIGVRESSTVEAKSVHYSLATDRQKFEFAADIASFANSDDGGLILIGFQTEKDDFGDDFIAEVEGCKALRGQIDRYRSVIESHIFPSVLNLRIEVGNFAGKYVVAILIPPQGERRKPFLVRGGIIDGDKVSLSAFSLPVRTGDRKRYISTEKIQTMLASVYAQHAL